MKERIWTQEVMMMYPKKWIVMINLGWDPAAKNQNKKLGEVYAVVDTRDEARKIVKSFGEDYEDVCIVPGYDPTPHVPGLIFK